EPHLDAAESGREGGGAAGGGRAPLQQGAPDGGGRELGALLRRQGHVLAGYASQLGHDEEEDGHERHAHEGEGQLDAEAAHTATSRAARSSRRKPMPRTVTIRLLAP